MIWELPSYENIFCFCFVEFFSSISNAFHRHKLFCIELIVGTLWVGNL